MARQNRNDTPDIRLSKALSSILRHNAEKENIPIRPDGFVLVADLMKNNKIRPYKLEDIARVVRDNEKKRFAMVKKETVEKNSEEASQDPGVPTEDQVTNTTVQDWYIRANQGHSLTTVKVAFKPLRALEDFPVAEGSEHPFVIHGTNSSAWSTIQKTAGLSRMNRTHIHMASGLFGEDHVVSGMRKKANVYIYIDIPKALEAGIPFELSANGVILSSGNDQGFIPKELFLHVKKRDQNTGELKEIFQSTLLTHQND